jgi:uncharacterized protein YjbI with pentapeptide repeats
MDKRKFRNALTNAVDFKVMGNLRRVVRMQSKHPDQDRAHAIEMRTYYWVASGNEYLSFSKGYHLDRGAHYHASSRISYGEEDSGIFATYAGFLEKYSPEERNTLLFMTALHNGAPSGFEKIFEHLKNNDGFADFEGDEPDKRRIRDMNQYQALKKLEANGLWEMDYRDLQQTVKELYDKNPDIKHKDAYVSRLMNENGQIFVLDDFLKTATELSREGEQYPQKISYRGQDGEEYEVFHSDKKIADKVQVGGQTFQRKQIYEMYLGSDLLEPFNANDETHPAVEAWRRNSKLGEGEEKEKLPILESETKKDEPPRWLRFRDTSLMPFELTKDAKDLEKTIVREKKPEAPQKKPEVTPPPVAAASTRKPPVKEDRVEVNVKTKEGRQKSAELLQRLTNLGKFELARELVSPHLEYLEKNDLKLPVGAIENANLDGAVFERYEINYIGDGPLSAQNTSFYNTNISADFPGGNFKGSEFIDVALDVEDAQEADFSDSSLASVTLLSAADFTNAKFTGATLERFEFKEDVNFSGADFSDARLQLDSKDFRKLTQWQGANLTHTRLFDEIFEEQDSDFKRDTKWFLNEFQNHTHINFKYAWLSQNEELAKEYGLTGIARAMEIEWAEDLDVDPVEPARADKEDLTYTPPAVVPKPKEVQPESMAESAASTEETFEVKIETEEGRKAFAGHFGG